MIVSCLELITTCIPPALPAVLAVGIVFALDRLKSQNIHCIAPPRINLAGTVQTFVFDKTGTLTEEGLSVLGFRTASINSEASSYQQHSVFHEFTKQVSDLAPEKPKNEKIIEFRSRNQ